MFRRFVTASLFFVVGFPILLYGGIPYFLLIGFLLTAAAWEYADIFRAVGSRPARWLVIAGVVVIVAVRFFHLVDVIPILTISALVLMAYHLVDYERGADHAGLDFGISLSALVYLGWVGAYLIDLRLLENGAWWVLFVLPCVWCADSCAYLIGVRYGKHRMAPRLSPKKSWEGYAAGAVSGLLTGGVLAYAYSTWGPLHLDIWLGAVFGLAVALITPLGDLGESMFKRQAGMKDSGNLLPGHGGAFDRLDSWIWAGVMGYFFVVWFMR